MTRHAVPLFVTLLGSIAGPLRSQEGGRRPAPELFMAIMEGGLARESAQTGFGQPLLNLLTEDAIVLWPGAPVVGTRAGAAVLLQALPDGARMAAATMQANRRILSSDSTRIFEWGVIAFDPDTAARLTPVVGRFMAVWRPAGNTWRIEALNVMNLSPDFVAPVVNPVPPPASTDSLDVFIRADRAFAARAQTAGAATAFSEWAAPDAVTFRGDGLLNLGPAEVSAALSLGDESAWRWTPVASGRSVDGELGWTAGEATISVAPGQGRPARTLHSKYLTFWRRGADGEFRFIADGGSARPGS